MSRIPASARIGASSAACSGPAASIDFGMPAHREPPEGLAGLRRLSDAWPHQRRPARLGGYGVRPADGGLEAFVEGEVTQVAVFDEHLTLARRISIAYGSTVIRIADRVTNNGFEESPLAVLYHVNVGWPVLAPGATLGDAGASTPRRRRCGGDRRPRGFWPFQDLAVRLRADAAGRAGAGIANSDDRCPAIGRAQAQLGRKGRCRPWRSGG